MYCCIFIFIFLISALFFYLHLYSCDFSGILLTSSIFFKPHMCSSDFICILLSSSVFPLYHCFLLSSSVFFYHHLYSSFFMCIFISLHVVSYIYLSRYEKVWWIYSDLEGLTPLLQIVIKTQKIINKLKEFVRNNEYW